MEQQELEGRFGPYKLLKRIARGGMGEVFLAKQDMDGGYERTLIVKRILPHLCDDEQFVEMFLREAHTASRFQHRNIVHIHRVGQEGSRHYIAMEYVDGKDLGAFLRRGAERGEGIPVALSCYIISEVCKGLGYAHAKAGPDGRPLGLVHRDVSPQNVLLSYDGSVRLIDFGIARAAEGGSECPPERVEGKVAYMSPEQARGEPVDQRSDIFSTGLLMFELLCGRRLLAGATGEEVLNALRGFSTNRALEPWRRRLPATLNRILERSLRERVGDRYQTVERMGRDLDGFLAASGFRAGSVLLAQWMSRFFQEEMALDQDVLVRTLTRPAPASKRPPANGAAPEVRQHGPGAGSGSGNAVADTPSAIRGDQRILKHKLVILVLLLIIVLEAIVFIVREVHWKREGLYRYRDVRKTVEPATPGGR